MTSNDTSDAGTYRGECPQCDEFLLGVTKQELVAHLEENGETLAAKMVAADMFVFEDDPGTPAGVEGFR